MRRDPTAYEWHVAHERAAKDVYLRTLPQRLEAGERLAAVGVR